MLKSRGICCMIPLINKTRRNLAGYKKSEINNEVQGKSHKPSDRKESAVTKSEMMALDSY